MPTEDERVREIGVRFEEKGWGLRLEQEGDRWVASFSPTVLTEAGYAATYAHEVRGRTELEAAEAAWAQYESDPSLGRKSD